MPDPEFPPLEGRRSVAGGSAQRKCESLRLKREVDTRLRHPRIGGLILAVTPEPRATTNWANGATGERRLGARLDGLMGAGVVTLHDRLVPGTGANIDHLVISPSGVWVIDAKRYSGQVAKKDVGHWFRRDIRLYVGGHDRTKLVTAMSTQVAVVRDALKADWAEIPVRSMLCFVDTEWALTTWPFEMHNVIVTGPRAACRRLTRPGPYAAETVELIAATLEKRLRPAS